MFFKNIYCLLLVLLVCANPAVAGPNANATVSLDLIVDGGSGNQMDDGVTSGTVSGQGTKIAVEVFAKGVTTSLMGVQITFDFKAEELKLDKVENSAFLFAIPEQTGINFAATAPVTLPSSGFIGRAEFSTVVDVTGKEFYLGIKSVTLAESAASSDVVTTTDVIAFNATSSPDFDGDGTVGFADFLQFAGQFGTRQGDGTYQARYDLDGNGAIDFSDFLIFANSFGTQVPPSGGGGGGSSGGGGATVTIVDANLHAVIADSLGKSRNASITRAEMATLTRIDAPNKGIRNLTGLEHATNLQWLYLGSVRLHSVNSNDISNLSPLSNLTNLKGLDLAVNSISDISALSNLTNLIWLNIWENSISDISALSNLTNLTRLNIWENSISDISALSNLTNLIWLNLMNNSISDISPLVANTGLGSGDTVTLTSNPLSSTSINTHIPALQRRGVTVRFDSSSGSGGGGGTSPPSGDAVTGSITDCSGAVGYVFISGTVRANRSVSNLVLTGYIGNSWVGRTSLGFMSAGQSKDFTITGLLGAPSGRCRVEMTWIEGGNKSQSVVDEQ